MWSALHRTGVSRPPFWGAIADPARIEFWKDGAHRLQRPLRLRPRGRILGGDPLSPYRTPRTEISSGQRGAVGSTSLGRRPGPVRAGRARSAGADEVHVAVCSMSPRESACRPDLAAVGDHVAILPPTLRIRSELIPVEAERPFSPGSCRWGHDACRDEVEAAIRIEIDQVEACACDQLSSITRLVQAVGAALVVVHP